MKKMIAIVLAVLLMVACLAGCGKKDTFVVGITDYAPMDYKDENGEWTGFDAEFARLFAEELDMEIGPDDEMPEVKESAKLLQMIQGEDVEKYDALLSLAITGGDYSWI